MGTFSSIISKVKAQFLPVRDEKLRMTFSGDLVAPHNGEYTGFIDGVLQAVPEEMTVSVPVFTIAKPISQVKEGDIIKTTGTKPCVKSAGTKATWTYHRVDKITNDKIWTSTFGGSSRKMTPIQDFFLKTKTVDVVVNLFAGGFNSNSNGFNPMMMLAFMDKEDGSFNMKDMLMMQMFSGQQGQNGFNPMMLLALKDDCSMGDDDGLGLMLMMSMMNGQNPFAAFANAAAPASTSKEPTDEVDAKSDAEAKA